MGEYVAGSRVTFVDSNGLHHNALVIHVWESTLNIAYVDPDESDSFGNVLIRETSVPFQEEGMLGFYIEVWEDAEQEV